MPEPPQDLQNRVAGAVRRHPALRALILFGSRASLPDTDAADAVILHLWQATQIGSFDDTGAFRELRITAPG